MGYSIALERAGISEKYSYVLRGFKDGFPQGISDHSIEGTGSFILENHMLATLAKDKIEEKIKKELEAKKMFFPFIGKEVGRVYQFFCSNPFGAVVKSDVLVQSINDLSFPRDDSKIPSVNYFLESDDFIPGMNSIQFHYSSAT